MLMCKCFAFRYFQRLAGDFEVQMQLYRQQIAELENHLESADRAATFTPLGRQLLLFYGLVFKLNLSIAVSLLNCESIYHWCLYGMHLHTFTLIYWGIWPFECSGFNALSGGVAFDYDLIPAKRNSDVTCKLRCTTH